MSREIYHECRDPEGRFVLISDRSWHTVISRDHPAVGEELAAAVATIEDPDMICEYADFADRDCFYRRGVVRRFPNYWLKVVVAPRSGDSETGFVLTAFIVDSVKGSEMVSWQRLNRDGSQ